MTAKRKRPKERPEQTPSLEVIRKKLRIPGKAAKLRSAHGMIVRGGHGIGIGEKAVYLNPQGEIELRQG